MYEQDSFSSIVGLSLTDVVFYDTCAVEGVRESCWIVLGCILSVREAWCEGWVGYCRGDVFPFVGVFSVLSSVLEPEYRGEFLHDPFP